MLDYRGETIIGKALYDIGEQEMLIHPVSLDENSSAPIEVDENQLMECINKNVLQPWTNECVTKINTHILESLELLDVYEYLDAHGDWNGYPLNTDPENFLYRLFRHHSLISANVYEDTNRRFCHTNELYIKWQRVHDLSISRILYNIGLESKRADGRFTKRFTAHLWNEHGLKLPGELVTELGNCYNASRTTDKTFNIKITNDFSWSDGEYGKDDSCWWSCYTHSRDTLYHYGGYGVLFYPSDDERTNHNHYDGIGRTWIYPVEDDLLIAFNSYGNDGKDAAAVIAKLMESITGNTWKYGKRELYNDGDHCYPYINGNNGHNDSGGSKCWAIYSNQKPSDTIHIDMDEKDGYFENDEDNMYSCDNCGNRFDENEMNSTPNDESYCDRCFSRYYTTCDSCNEVISNDDTHTFDDRSGDYCESCYDDMYSFTCYDCGDNYSDRYNSSGEDQDGNVYCENCLGNLTHCEVHDDVYYIDRDGCNQCKEDEIEAHKLEMGDVEDQLRLAI